MQTIPTATLIGTPLDWAVAHCEKLAPTLRKECLFLDGGPLDDHDELYSPSTIWDQAGPIIAREGIDLHQIRSHRCSTIGLRHYNPSKGDEVVYDVRRNCQMVRRPREPHPYEGQWFARMSVNHSPFGWQAADSMSGSALVSAMRCYVTFKLGASVELPDEVAALACDEPVV